MSPTTTTFPAQIDTFVNPLGTDSVQLVSHAAQHTKVNDALYAIEMKLGVNNSTDPNSIENRISTIQSFIQTLNSNLGGLEDSLGDYLLLSIYEDEKASPGGIATLDEDGYVRDEQISPTIARDAEVATAIDAARAQAVGQADVSAMSKIAIAKQEAQTFATNADTDLHTTVTGEIATAKSQAISAAAADATTKANQARLDAISAVTNSAPAVLDTLKELSDALGSDPNFATTMTTNLAGKSNVGHTHTSSNITDFLEAAQDASALLFNHSTHNNVTATYDDANNKIILSVTPQLTQEQVQDYIVPLFESANNKNMNIMYDDEANQLILEAITEPSKAVMSDTAPLNPAHGAFWLDTDEFRSGVRALKVYNAYPAAYKGPYDNGADYTPGDVVSYSGAFYIRVGETNPGYPPGTSYWESYSFTPNWEYASTALGLATENVWTAKNTFSQGVIIGMNVAPTSPVQGQIYYNLAAEKLRVFDGLVWKDVSGGAGGGGGLPNISTDGSATPSTLFFGMIAPPSAAALEGDIWFDVDDLGMPYGQFFTGTTAPDPNVYEFWVDPNPAPGELIYSADEPATPQYEGELWIDTDDYEGQLVEVGSSTPNPDNVQLWVDINDLDTPSYYTNLVFSTYVSFNEFPAASSKPGMLAVAADTGLVYVSINNTWVVQPTQIEHAKTRIQSQSTQALLWMGFL